MRYRSQISVHTTVYQQLHISVTGRGLITLFHCQLQKMEHMQYEAMQFILGCTGNTIIVCHLYICWLSFTLGVFRHSTCDSAL